MKQVKNFIWVTLEHFKNMHLTAIKFVPSNEKSPFTVHRFVAKKLLPLYTLPTHQILHHVTLSFSRTQDGNKEKECCITMILAKSMDTFAKFQKTVTLRFDLKLGEVKLHLCLPFYIYRYSSLSHKSLELVKLGCKFFWALPHSRVLKHT